MRFCATEMHYKKSLEDTFMKMDRLILSDKGKKELRTKGKQYLIYYELIY